MGVALLALAAGASGCVGESAPRPPVATHDQVVCRYVRPTGSNLAVKECRTVQQMKQEAQEARDALRRSSSEGSPADR